MATIRRRGDKWQVQVRRAGHQNLARSFLTKKDAEAWARLKEIQADRGELPHAANQAVLQETTLGELVERYRDEVCPRKRCAQVEISMLNVFLREPMCRMALAEITTQTFASYRDERLKTIKPNSLRRMLSPLRNLFEVARDEWAIPVMENPVANLRLFNSDTKRERRLREGEWDKLVEVARSFRNPLVLQVVRFALATAMRRSEILAMRWVDVDYGNRCLLIPNSKNGHSRTIPLTPEALDVLTDLSRETDDVFPMSVNAFRLSWQRLQRRADIEDLRFHDLRHEAISRFFERGLSVPEVALISGHRDARMLFRYTHPLREQIVAKLHRSKRSD